MGPAEGPRKTPRRLRQEAAVAVLIDYFRGPEGAGRLGPDEHAEWWLTPRQMADDLVEFLEDEAEPREILRAWLAGRRAS